MGTNTRSDKSTGISNVKPVKRLTPEESASMSAKSAKELVIKRKYAGKERNKKHQKSKRVKDRAKRKKRKEKELTSKRQESKKLQTPTQKRTPIQQLRRTQRKNWKKFNQEIRKSGKLEESQSSRPLAGWSRERSAVKSTWLTLSARVSKPQHH